MTTIKELRKGRKVIFDTGNFDDWCVYVVEPDGTRYAPYDVMYFADLKSLNAQYGYNKVYHDFLKIYTPTGKDIDPAILSVIDSIVMTYLPEDQNLVEQWLTVIYAGMVAEENKSRAILKKRIKHLGIHQTLIQGFDPAVAAKFSVGKNWRELDNLMRKWGI